MMDNEHLVETYELFRNSKNNDTLHWRYPKDGQLYALGVAPIVRRPFRHQFWRFTRERGNPTPSMDRAPFVMAFLPGRYPSNDGILVLSLEGADSHAAWLVHVDDDVPHKCYGAVDLGNSHLLPGEIRAAFRKGARVPYFILRVAGEADCPVRPGANLGVAVLKPVPRSTTRPPASNQWAMAAPYYPFLPQHILPATAPSGVTTLDTHDAYTRFLQDADRDNILSFLRIIVLNPKGFDAEPSGKAVEYHGVFKSDNSKTGGFGSPLVPVGMADRVTGVSYNRRHLATAQEFARRLRSKGISTIGYVYTGWFGHDKPGSAHIRTLDQVRENVDHWYKNFDDLDGIFFDEVSQYPGLVGTDEQWASIASVPHRHESLPYRALYEHVKSKSIGKKLVVFNASNWHDNNGQYEFPLGSGQMTSYRGNELYMRACDILGSYEGPFASYRLAPGSNVNDPAKFKEVSWSVRYSAQRFWHIISGVKTQSDALDAIRIAKNRRVRYIYVCNNLVEVPSYYISELAEIGQDLP